jgi:hypothetical protein
MFTARPEEYLIFAIIHRNIKQDFLKATSKLYAHPPNKKFLEYNTIPTGLIDARKL